MQEDFEQSNLPPIKWYISEAIEIKGEFKIEWDEPGRGTFTYNEEQLAMIERSARDMLIQRHKAVEPEWTIDRHAYWRDRHYNAESGLEKVQLAKKERNIELDTPFRPVIK